MALVNVTKMTQKAVTNGLIKVATKTLANNATVSGVVDEVTGAATQAAKAAIAQGSATASALLSSTDIAGLTKNVASNISSLFSDVASPKASDVKTGVPDPLKASLNKIGKAGSFLTNSLTSQTTPIDFGEKAGLGIAELSKLDGGLLGAVASRIGAELPSTDGMLADLKSAVGDVMKSDMVRGITSGLQDVRDAIAPVTDAVGSAITDVKNELGSFMGSVGSEFKELTGMPGDLAKYFTPGLPSSANADGSPIFGLPTSTDSTLTSVMNNVGKKLGLTSAELPVSSNYSKDQNLFNASIGYAAEKGLTAYVTAFAQKGTTSGKYNSTTQSVLKSVLPSVVGQGNVGMVNTLVGLISPSKIGNKTSLVQRLVSNPAIVRSAVGGVESLMGTLGVTSEDVFGTGDKVGNKIVWNQPRVTAANSTITKVILPEAVTKAAAAVPISDSQGGLIAGWR